MSPALQVTLLFACAFACLAMIWRARWLPVAVAVMDAQRQPQPKQPEDSDEEQLPETDRAPRGVSHLLTYAVAVTAAVRLGLLVTLHR